MVWFWYSAAAAVLWGLSYALTEKALGRVSVYGYLASSYLIEFLVVGFLGWRSGKFREDLASLERPSTVWLLVLVSLLHLGGNFCISTSIQGKNASLASIVEISYPFFTIGFSYLLFREVQVTTGALFGALLIFAGVALILRG